MNAPRVVLVGGRGTGDGEVCQSFTLLSRMILRKFGSGDERGFKGCEAGKNPGITVVEDSEAVAGFADSAAG